jgi:hypothetical protein
MPGLLRGVARTAVVAGTAAHVAGNVQHRQQRKWAGQEAQEQQQNEAAPTTGAGITDDQIAQLDKLGQLKERGVLTEAEFNAKKQQILGI